MVKPILRVAAIHDICSFSKVSLTTVIPVLSAMGIQVCPIVTAVLSANTAYLDPFFRDLTADLPHIFAALGKMKVQVDAVYSGFLGSEKQCEMVADYIGQQQEKPLVIIDPVLGDDEKLYSCFSTAMVDKMRELIKFADVITPNLTEAALLLEREIPAHFSNAVLKNWLLSLSEFGPEIVIITSIPETEYKTAVIAYNKTDGRFWKVCCDYIPTSYPGTGDAFTSVITGSLLSGDSLPLALDRAVNFISLAIRATFGHKLPPEEGILLEKVLDTLKMPVQVLSYQILN